MTIVLAGGSGFLGRSLADALAADGHAVLVLSRQGQAAMPGHAPAPGRVESLRWRAEGSVGPWSAALDGADALVNLAGESIAARRWSAAQKTRLADSRLAATRSLVAAIAGADRPPRVFVSASAIGYYGNRGEETLSETSTPGDDFLADLCVRWEREAERAASAQTRVVTIRTGIVLDPAGGALAQMLPPFKMFVGGPLGSGRQYMSWIHHADWQALARWAIDTEAVSGPINATAPEPETNADFSRALGRALHRPSLLPAPAFALRLLLGEMAGPLLLASQRVLPAKPQALGFQFTHPRLDAALASLFPRSTR
jgi:hypothetical protein